MMNTDNMGCDTYIILQQKTNEDVKIDKIKHSRLFSGRVLINVPISMLVSTCGFYIGNPRAMFVVFYGFYILQHVVQDLR